jgi:hypothetical protein
LGNGRDDLSLNTAGGNVVIDEQAGLSQTLVEIDGNLATIDTTAEVRSVDPTAHTGGAASARYSRSFLLRWLVKLTQLIDAKLPTLINSRIPVETRFSVGVCTAATVEVDTTSTSILASNGNRTSVVIVNNGSADVFIRRGTPAIAGQGILLKAEGGFYEINASNLYTGVITAITASGTTNLALESCL